MNEEQRAAAVLEVLREKLALPEWTKHRRDPYETLIITILSQNTSDTNTARAFESLSNKFEITPSTLANTPLAKIEVAIRSAGLYKSKARTIREASHLILEKYCGSLAPVFALPLEDARKALTEISGVGPKTADVVLLFSAGQHTLPVDTHVNRVAKRLGFAPGKAHYEGIRAALQAVFDPADFLAVHLLLIAHGRKTCKAQRPLCNQCPIGIYCPSCGKWSQS